MAEVNYREKKRLKGEIVDEDKMRNALNQRKKIRQLCRKLLGSIVGKGVDLLKEANNARKIQLIEQSNIIKKKGFIGMLINNFK